ncbi:MAG TPA: pilus assembly protein TadG-related protein [Egibacteraceae bacterium]
MHDDRGSVTLWLLGLCVVLLFVGGLSLDLWRAFSERRALANAVDAAAVAGASGLAVTPFRASDALHLDPEAAEQRAWATLRTQTDTGALTHAAVSATAEQVTVTASGRVELTLLRTLLPDVAPLEIRVTATSEPRGPAG